MIFDKYSDENRHFICHIPCLSLHHTNAVLLMYFRCRHQVALSVLSARANFNCDVIITSVSRFAMSRFARPVPPLPPPPPGTLKLVATYPRGGHLKLGEVTWNWPFSSFSLPGGGYVETSVNVPPGKLKLVSTYPLVCWKRGTLKRLHR